MKHARSHAEVCWHHRGGIACRSTAASQTIPALSCNRRHPAWRLGSPIQSGTLSAMSAKVSSARRPLVRWDAGEGRNCSAFLAAGMHLTSATAKELVMTPQRQLPKRGSSCQPTPTLAHRLRRAVVKSQPRFRQSALSGNRKSLRSSRSRNRPCGDASSTKRFRGRSSCRSALPPGARKTCTAGSNIMRMIERLALHQPASTSRRIERQFHRGAV